MQAGSGDYLRQTGNCLQFTPERRIMLGGMHVRVICIDNTIGHTILLHQTSCVVLFAEESTSGLCAGIEKLEIIFEHVLILKCK